MDYVAAMNQNWGFCLAVEKLMEADDEKEFAVPERAEYLRVLICELNRIASHLLSFGTYGNGYWGIHPISLCLPRS